jgi:photosystem II stability/assembly factor-like uncharacterized protein
MKNIIKFFVLLFFMLLVWIDHGFSQEGWYSQESGTQSDLFGVWFIDSNTGIVVGGFPGNCILKTKDAGTTWNPQTYPEIGNSYFAGVCFSDSMNGWVSGEYGVIMRTRDGGTTWTQQTSKTIKNLEAVFAVDSNIVWAMGEAGTIVHTIDGGANWGNQESGIKTHIWRISFINADTGSIAAGNCIGCIPADTIGGFILRTINGGITWNIQKHDSLTLGFYGVSFTDVKTGTVVGTGGTILHTTNGGETWTSQTSGTTVDLWDVFFANTDTGFVVGGDWSSNTVGIILRTTNGGVTWTKQDIPKKNCLNKVFFSDINIGTAVGNDGTILRTWNGGVTWIEEHRIDKIPQNSSLNQNYPNPFDQSTNIKFEISEYENVTLKIYSIDGKLVTTLVNEKMRPGSYEVVWNAANNPAGVYFCRLKAGSYIESMSMEVVR